MRTSACASCGSAAAISWYACWDSVKLVVVQQRLRKSPLAPGLSGSMSTALLVGGDGVLRVLDLLVSRTERECDSFAVRSSSGTAFSVSMARLRSPLLTIQPRKIQSDIFGIGIDLLCCLELLPAPAASRDSRL